MVSYKIYKISDDIEKVENIIINSNFLNIIENQIKLSENKLITSKYSVFLKRIKNLTYVKNRGKSDFGKFNLNFNYPILKENDLWINLECFLKIGNKKNIIFFQYNQPQLLSFFNEIFLKPMDLKKPLFYNIEFKNIKLIKLYEYLKKLIESNSNNRVNLHRIIIKNFEIEGILLEEGNFKGKNEEISNILSLVKKGVSDVRVITFKILWDENLGNKLIITLRIDYYGKIIIYGNHPDKIINTIFNYLEEAISNI